METLRCYLKEICEKDFEDLKQIYVNEEVRKYLGGIIPEEHIHTKFIDTLNRSDNADTFFQVVRLKGSKEFIGLVSLDQHIDGGTEVSYEFLPFWWGQGFASEILNRVITYAFKDMGLTKLLAETQTANKSSCKLLERMGMKMNKKIQRFGAEQGLYSLESPFNALGETSVSV